jgi:hypothetical protein
VVPATPEVQPEPTQPNESSVTREILNRAFRVTFARDPVLDESNYASLLGLYWESSITTREDPAHALQVIRSLIAPIEEKYEGVARISDCASNVAAGFGSPGSAITPSLGLACFA